MPDAIADIIASHDRTKHHPERYANGWLQEEPGSNQFRVRSTAICSLTDGIASHELETCVTPSDALSRSDGREERSEERREA